MQTDVHRIRCRQQHKDTDRRGGEGEIGCQDVRVEEFVIKISHRKLVGTKEEDEEEKEEENKEDELQSIHTSSTMDIPSPQRLVSLEFGKERVFSQFSCPEMHTSL